MNCKIVILCLVLAAVKGQIQDINKYEISAERSDDYNKMNELQHDHVIEVFDNEIANYKHSFTEKLDDLALLRDKTIANIVRMQEYLNPLALLSNRSNKCVTENRKILYSVLQIETNMNNCITQASSTLTTILAAAVNHRNAVYNYYQINYKAELKKCAESFNQSSGNYTSCITLLNANTDSNTALNRKTFATLMDNANCVGTANIKVAVECIQINQSNSESRIAECKVLVNRCMMGLDDCKPCPAACPVSFDYQVDYTNENITNPFKGHDKLTSGCVLYIKN